MPTYKLMYFPTTGRAELARLLFAEAGVEYEDVRIPKEEWPKVKPTTPFGQMPVLFIGDEQLPQSGAIVRYLAKEFNLEGESALLAARADALVETFQDVGTTLVPLYYIQDEKEKSELAQKAFETSIGPIFEKLEARFVASTGEFLVGESLTYTDIALFNIVDFINMFDTAFIEKYPKLNTLVKQVAIRPKIKKWLDIRH